MGIKGSPLRKQFDYITDSQVEWAPMDDAYDIAISGNERYNFVSSWKRLKKELKTSFPNDTEAIEKYFSTCHYTVEYIFPLYLALTLSCLWYPIFIFLASRYHKLNAIIVAAISHQAAYSTTPYHRI